VDKTALDGVRVLDLTQVMAGPFCSQILADLGADVIKVEPVTGGDSSRTSMGSELPHGESSAFLALNRTKRSIALDLKTARGLGVFRALAKQSDVVLENFRPGVMARLGIDYDALSDDNPGLIFTSISGFGQDGPYRERAGYDLIAQALSGVMSVTGERSGPPVKCGLPIADLAAGLYAVIGILAALRVREASGQGQHIDVSLLDSAFALSIWETAELWATGKVPARIGSAHRMVAPYQAFETADGYLVLGANNDRLWKRLCDSLGRPELLDDPRFKTNAERMRNLSALSDELSTCFRTNGTDHWVEVLLDAGLPAAPIKDYAASCRDPHLAHRQMIVEMTHPREGEVKALGLPIKFSDMPLAAAVAPPLLGEHSDALLSELGFDLAERESMRADGVVA
jgi:crotonobetainyl-CoA:carnitine CoA-transferase CaiB-like acyl-CoA transferase